MIVKGSKINIKDNTGIKKIKCLKIYKGSKKNLGLLGTIIYSTINKSKNKKSYVKKLMYKSLLINLKKKTRRVDGSFILFSSNNALILKDDYTFLGTNIKAPICKEIRTIYYKKVYKRIVSYAKLTI